MNRVLFTLAFFMMAFFVPNHGLLAKSCCEKCPPQGPTGPAGPDGLTGATGPTGSSGCLSADGTITFTIIPIVTSFNLASSNSSTTAADNLNKKTQGDEGSFHAFVIGPDGSNLGATDALMPSGPNGTITVGPPVLLGPYTVVIVLDTVADPGPPDGTLTVDTTAGFVQTSFSPGTTYLYAPFNSSDSDVPSLVYPGDNLQIVYNPYTVIN